MMLFVILIVNLARHVAKEKSPMDQQNFQIMLHVFSFWREHFIDFFIAS